MLQKNFLFCSCIIDQFDGKDLVFPSLENGNETWQGDSLCAICCPLENLPRFSSSL